MNPLWVAVEHVDDTEMSACHGQNIGLNDAKKFRNVRAHLSFGLCQTWL